MTNLFFLKVSFSSQARVIIMSWSSTKIWARTDVVHMVIENRRIYTTALFCDDSVYTRAYTIIGAP